MSDLERLLADPETRRCYDEVVTGEKPLSLDGILSCYGGHEFSADDDDALLVALNALVEDVRLGQVSLARATRKLREREQVSA